MIIGSVIIICLILLVFIKIRNKPKVSNKEIEPIISVYGNLTFNKKKSIVNFLTFLAVSDSNGSFDTTNLETELLFLNKYAIALKVNSKECEQYYSQSNAFQIMVNDLKGLTEGQKTFLINTALGLIFCDGPMNEKEFGFLMSVFEPIGITESILTSEVDKLDKLYNLYF
jgi:hypothetical protein